MGAALEKAKRKKKDLSLLNYDPMLNISCLFKSCVYNFELSTKVTVTLAFFFNFFVFLLFLWAALAAYGGSQARGQIGAVATGLRQSHSKAGSKPSLQPTPQLTAMPDP